MITVNGKEVTLTGPLSVADYLEQNNYQIKRIAVEMNGDIYQNTAILTPCSKTGTVWRL